MTRRGSNSDQRKKEWDGTGWEEIRRGERLNHPENPATEKYYLRALSPNLGYLDNGLKDITKLDDFNQVVDFKNSYFYKQALSSNIKS